MEAPAELARTRTRRAALIISAVAGVMVAAFTASTVLRPAGTTNALFDTYVYNGVVALASLVCALIATERRPDRWAWACFSAALAAILSAEVVIVVGYGGYDELPYPSWADALFLSYYPFVITAVVLLLRRQVKVGLNMVGLDAVVSGLAVAAYVTWVAVTPILGAAEGSLLESLVYLAVPAFDLLLVVLVVIARSMLGRSAGRHWWVLLGFLLVQAVADTTYYLMAINETYVEGGLLDATWPTAALMTTIAALTWPADARQIEERGWVHLAAPTAVGLAALLLMVVDRFVMHVPTVSFVFALAAVICVAIRTIWGYRELAELATRRREALTDDLTGLMNRRGLRDELARRIDASDSERRAFSLGVIDLDRFKEINDSLGHAAGDRVLAVVADRMRSLVGEHDVVARLAGDEFAVLVDDPQRSAPLAEDIVMVLAEDIDFDGVALQVRSSVGYAQWPADALDLDDLMAAADHAMYRAKESGGGMVAFDRNRDEPDRNTVELTAALRHGIAHGEVVPFYQPKVDLLTGDVLGFEALVRWVRPSGLENGGRTVSPDVLLPIAERGGLLGDLTRCMLHQSLRDLARWQVARPGLTMAVNVNATTLLHQGFTSMVIDALQSAGVDARSLVIEITEHTLVADNDRSRAVLGALRAAGIAISVDDYGTGHSSLSYLRDLPAEELKLDRSFVGNLRDHRVVAIVRSTVWLAETIGLRIVAEGIENGATAKYLAELGCQVGQGYHFLRPAPAADIEAWLAARRRAWPAPDPRQLLGPRAA
jgi:diguanylate cyclase